ncbi:sulfurtransferase [Pseudomonas nicosulfuronedens]|uniref:Sulfurtransferase n=1 Tax=Pseudomonas nicosulfuronedens TaxID=2571105 RepID=A0A5R9RAE1_9PSED|nr:sulfurtransferase [Pseudomonas nicosulfuronedens]MDH1011507.1 sulfurtransferase [Pseudomonas nicosulfuronedens]MDH1979793.1 sulfurtransferase [Pseudomonas nicosulfuronedens]MDH2028228.1 sulfurtransferase [Pseudomonas nicosulfuronedens]TLX80110.1 sulfurtransferase [Pseudomonas nicosulfuronedens]
MTQARLLTPEQLAARLDDPNLVLLDCRFSLEDPAYGARSYQENHIPGAHFADLNRDLSSPVIPGITGRHPLPDPQHLQEHLRAWGLNADSEVVLYDDGPGAFAARAWWLLLWLGKSEGVYLLDGGLTAWRNAGLRLTTAETPLRPGDFKGEPDNRLLISASELAAKLGEAELPLIDARGLPRFRGEVEPIDPVAGHIPGAQCAAFTDNLGNDGRFLRPEHLHQRFAGLLRGRPAEDLVAYCGSGVTACHNLFALSLAGYPLGRLYAGSWSEWITDTRRPVAKGD